MARMSIDDKFLRDPRIKRLAAKLCFTVFEARGRLLEVFAVTYDRTSDVMSIADVDTAAELEGFAAAMVEMDLAERVADAVRIRGAHERIKYLDKKRESGAEGGRKSGESRSKEPAAHKRRSTAQSSASTEAKHEKSEPEARGNPNLNIPDNPSASVPDPVSVPVPEKNAPAKPSRASRESGHHALRQQVIAAFHEYFVKASGGAKPTWTDADRGIIGELVRKHGAHECVRRVAILRDHPPDFPRGVWAVRDFARFFDKLASPRPTAKSGRVEPSTSTAYVDGEVAL